MAFIYQRTIRFQETDAAGVVYFANGLSICHEAYEASLVAAGIELKMFFRDATIAVPIVHARIDFFQPMTCGDRVEVYLTPRQMRDSEFEIAYSLKFSTNAEKSISQALTRHVCIDPVTRSRRALSPALMTWLSQWSDPTNLARSS